MSARDYAGAAALLRPAADGSPIDVEANNKMSYVLLQAGDGPGAAAYGRRALAARPDSPRLMCNVARALSYAGELEEALTLLERAAALQPSWGEPYTVAAELCLEHTLYMRAEERCRAG